MIARVTAVAAALAAVTACGDVEEILDRSYDDRFGAATTMDIYAPADGATGRPALMMIHGGGWSKFSKEAYTDNARRFARAGYVTATINYRLVPDGSYPRQIQDCVCALSFLRANADELGIDPDRIAVAGYSAGGHLASLLGVGIDTPDFAPDCQWGPTGPPAAVISGAGPQDMWTMPEVDAVIDMLGGTKEQVPERYDLASPLYHVASGAPPYLLIHGTADLFVDLDQSERMYEALLAAGNDARLLKVPGNGHLFGDGDGGDQQFVIATDTPEAWAVSIDFLDRTLGAP